MKRKRSWLKIFSFKNSICFQKPKMHFWNCTIVVHTIVQKCIFISYIKARQHQQPPNVSSSTYIGQGQSNSQKKKNAITFAIYLALKKEKKLCSILCLLLVKKKNLCIAYCAIVLQLYAYYSLAPTISLKTFSILLVCILVILQYSILSWLGECHNEIIHTCGGKYCMSSSLSSSLLSNSIWQNCTMWWEFDYF